MLKKLNALPKPLQHLHSTLLSILCMTTAACISSTYYNIASENSANIVLVFTFFLIIISCITVSYLYGIICSLLTVIWFNFIYVPPYLNLNLTLSGYPITLLGMCAITILVRAISSHLIKQENLVAEREKELLESDKEKMRANLLRAVSHDLRTPLTGIIGNSLAYLENQNLLTNDEKEDIIRNIYEDSTWLINMVENLLTITRINDSGLTIGTREEPVEEVVAEALQKMEKRHEDCVIHATIPDDFIMLPMDALLIEQVTINLLENAFFHSGSHDPIDFIVEDYPDYVSFTVRDYGKGIPEHRMNNLFDGTSYTSSHTDSPDVQRGMGVGLVICKTIITAHKGTISGHNHERGAEFTFTLPKGKEQ